MYSEEFYREVLRQLNGTIQAFAYFCVAPNGGTGADAQLSYRDARNDSEFDASSDLLSVEAVKGIAGENLYDSSWNNLIPLVTDESSPLQVQTWTFGKIQGTLHAVDPNMETFFSHRYSPAGSLSAKLIYI